MGEMHYQQWIEALSEVKLHRVHQPAETYLRKYLYLEAVAYFYSLYEKTHIIKYYSY